MIVVQIGANRGNDELISIIKDATIDKLVLVKPLEKFNENLLKCYSHIKNLIIENIVITDDNTKHSEFFYLHSKMDDNSEQASLLQSHINKVFNRPEYKLDGTYEEQVIQTEIKCCTINDLFKKHNLSNIDILFIDAEGFDDKIIRSIDFEKNSIRKIYYENIHIDNQALINFLNDKGYSVVNGTSLTENNSLATKLYDDQKPETLLK